MRTASSKLNIVLISAIVTAALATFIAPRVIETLFTTPMTSGVNCEPAAIWSMSKLAWTQFTALVLGGAFAGTFLMTRKNRAPHVDQNSTRQNSEPVMSPR